MTKNIRLIAFYLPQFHPIPENDEWWGRGFTEWNNVVKARPLFKGHYQPHIPRELGFYDLRVPETRIAQAEMAQSYGIDGFCYWHYWFNGKQLLEKPFTEISKSRKPDFPFCLAWANESWSRGWIGEEKDILIKQTYSTIDDINHIRWLMQAFLDLRYIKIYKRPLFLIYRPRDLLEPKKTTDLFREKCIKSGVPEPYLVGIDAHCINYDCRQLGFDGTLKFEPQLGLLPDFNSEKVRFSKLIRNARRGIINARLRIYDYSDARSLMDAQKPDFPYYPSICVGWDNTPRRNGKAVIFVNSTADRFGEGLLKIIKSVQCKPYEERLVFINAWNEWAEGNHLEPDMKNGLAYLEKLKLITNN